MRPNRRLPWTYFGRRPVDPGGSASGSRRIRPELVVLVVLVILNLALWIVPSRLGGDSGVERDSTQAAPPNTPSSLAPTAASRETGSPTATATPTSAGSGGSATAQERTATPIAPRSTPASVPTRTPAPPSPEPAEPAAITLDEFSSSARPFEPVALHGTFPGQADTTLRIQRRQSGEWVDFPIPTTTGASGRFTGYVELGRPGRHRLRVLDPESGAASRPIVLDIER
jgi:hypothetical protein